MFAQNRFIKLFQDDEETIITIIPEERLNLDYHKNNIIHFFVPEAILALGLSTIKPLEQLNRKALAERTEFLSILFKYEFIYPPHRLFKERFEAALDLFIDESIIAYSQKDKRAKTIEIIDIQTIEFFSNLLFNFLESYWVASMALSYLIGKSHPLDDFLAQIQTPG